MDSRAHLWEAVLCKSTACINTSTDTAYTDIHNNNVSSLGLEQQHEQLCSNTMRNKNRYGLTSTGSKSSEASCRLWTSKSAALLWQTSKRRGTGLMCEGRKWCTETRDTHITNRWQVRTEHWKWFSTTFQDLFMCVFLDFRGPFVSTFYVYRGQWISNNNITSPPAATLTYFG